MQLLAAVVGPVDGDVGDATALSKLLLEKRPQALGRFRFHDRDKRTSTGADPFAPKVIYIDSWLGNFGKTGARIRISFDSAKRKYKIVKFRFVAARRSGCRGQLDLPLTCGSTKNLGWNLGCHQHWWSANMPSIRPLMAATLAAGLAIVPAAQADDWHGHGYGYGGYHGYGHGDYHGYGYGSGHYHGYGYGAGAAVAGGLIGAGIGAAIASGAYAAPPPPVYAPPPGYYYPPPPPAVYYGQ